MDDIVNGARWNESAIVAATVSSTFAAGERVFKAIDAGEKLEDLADGGRRVRRAFHQGVG